MRETPDLSIEKVIILNKRVRMKKKILRLSLEALKRK